MGTNYYYIKDPCAHCGRGSETLHIGKSSFGWCFSLHIIPDEGITSLEDWKEIWPQGRIENEYGEAQTPEEMLAVIMDRKREDPVDWTRAHSDARTLSDFLNENGATIDEKYNLLRHRLSGYCIANGDGPYDLFPGDFC